MKVLAIGSGSAQVARQFWPEAEIDITDIVPGKKRKDYDALIAYHVLGRVAIREGQAALKTWLECVVPGGEIQVYTPSLEWAAEQILSETPSPATIFHLFGTQTNQENFFVCAYTLRDLRTMLERAGVDVIHAREGLYSINEHDCGMHLLIGKKK